MIDVIAAIITTLFGLFWIAVQIIGWVILGSIVLAPVFWIASFFIAPPPD